VRVSETVYPGRANALRWQLREAGDLMPAEWWHQVTRITLRLGDYVVDSHAQHARVISWSDGAIIFRLGLLPVALQVGRYTPVLTVYTSADPEGIRWGDAPQIRVAAP
jgi:hypothetical protein